MCRLLGKKQIQRNEDMSRAAWYATVYGAMAVHCAHL